ncbi:hypothetical protein BV25DRAFT_1569971 [Artomyces pyxidatus]|uniref:Uncharacterized protein n=1 Tax=Artomyces pyxidatus TaxID=48021 RepID=A0ACB8SIU1_9AGAM|nr:hypothetical protein BV25DRAFT_1569971 [Artomyces pyxidatus]
MPASEPFAPRVHRIQYFIPTVHIRIPDAALSATPFRQVDSRNGARSRICMGIRASKPEAQSPEGLGLKELEFESSFRMSLPPYAVLRLFYSAVHAYPPRAPPHQVTRVPPTPPPTRACLGGTSAPSSLEGLRRGCRPTAETPFARLRGRAGRPISTEGVRRRTSSRPLTVYRFAECSACVGGFADCRP